MALQITDTQQCAFSLLGSVDAAGNLPTFDALAITVDDPAIVSATIDATGAGMVVAAGVGTANCTITDTETDGTIVNLVFPVTVVGGEAVSLAVSFGSPEPIPAAPAAPAV